MSSEMRHKEPVKTWKPEWDLEIENIWRKSETKNTAHITACVNDLIRDHNRLYTPEYKLVTQAEVSARVKSLEHAGRLSATVVQLKKTGT